MRASRWHEWFISYCLVLMSNKWKMTETLMSLILVQKNVSGFPRQPRRNYKSSAGPTLTSVGLRWGGQREGSHEAHCQGEQKFVSIHGAECREVWRVCSCVGSHILHPSRIRLIKQLRGTVPRGQARDVPALGAAALGDRWAGHHSRALGFKSSLNCFYCGTRQGREQEYSFGMRAQGLFCLIYIVQVPYASIFISPFRL